MKAAAVLSLLLLSLPEAGAAQPRAGCFSIQAEHASYLLGEPVYLRISSSEVRPPSLEETTITLAVLLLTKTQVRSALDAHRTEDGEYFYHPPLRLRSHPQDAQHPSAPALMYNRFSRLIANDGGLLFRKPGRYRLRLFSGSRIISDSLTVSVLAPSAPADRRAFALIARNPGEYALAVYLEGGDQLKEGMTIIRGLAGFKSAYTRLASFVLSSDWSQDYTDYHGGRSRPLDLEKAMSLAQWNPSLGWYIPLRTAYRLRTAAVAVAASNPTAPGLPEVWGRLNGFEASLTPEAKALLISF